MFASFDFRRQGTLRFVREHTQLLVPRQSIGFDAALFLNPGWRFQDLLFYAPVHLRIRRVRVAFHFGKQRKGIPESFSLGATGRTSKRAIHHPAVLSETRCQGCNVLFGYFPRFNRVLSPPLLGAAEQKENGERENNHGTTVIIHRYHPKR